MSHFVKRKEKKRTVVIVWRQIDVIESANPVGLKLEVRWRGVSSKGCVVVFKQNLRNRIERWPVDSARAGYQNDVHHVSAEDLGDCDAYS